MFNGIDFLTSTKVIEIEFIDELSSRSRMDGMVVNWLIESYFLRKKEAFPTQALAYSLNSPEKTPTHTGEQSCFKFPSSTI